MLFTEKLDHDNDRVAYYKLQVVAKIMSYSAKLKKSSARFYVGEASEYGMTVTTICSKANGSEGLEAISLRIRDAILSSKLRSDLDRLASVALKEYEIRAAA